MVKRLSGKELEIMALLTARGELYGLEMVAASPALKASTIYVTLLRMAGKGLVTSRTVKSAHIAGLPRRLFKATDAGARLLAAQRAADAVFASMTR